VNDRQFGQGYLLVGPSADHSEVGVVPAAALGSRLNVVDGQLPDAGIEQVGGMADLGYSGA
jgi:hypothetical protein